MQTLKRYKWTWLMLLAAVIMAVYLVVNSLSFGDKKLPVIGEVQTSLWRMWMDSR